MGRKTRNRCVAPGWQTEDLEEMRESSQVWTGKGAIGSSRNPHPGWRRWLWNWASHKCLGSDTPALLLAPDQAAHLGQVQPSVLTGTACPPSPVPAYFLSSWAWEPWDTEQTWPEGLYHCLDCKVQDHIDPEP